jgi:secreted PhoX family phosphatase
MKKQLEGGSPFEEPREPQRRSFFRRSGAMAGAVVTGTTLAALSAHMAQAHEDEGRERHGRRPGRRSDYGELQRTPDQNGDVILALPKGFQYVTFSKTGDPFGDGLLVPAAHDGMAAFDGPGHTIRLIRNHEVTAINAPFPVRGPAALKYDAKGPGGCTTLDFDTRSKRLVRQFVSLSGSINNCSGGWSRGNTGWMTCEENVSGVNQGYEKPHGYVYFVPASAHSAVPAVPMKAMGRFAHEGAVSDSRGIIYLTEDSGNNSGFYRFIPNDADRPLAGGVLQMLAVTGEPTAAMIVGQVVGLRRLVSWVTIPVPDPNLEGGGLSCFAQGRAAGGAAFNRLEGVFRGEDGRSMYFVSTSGGTVKGPDGDGYGQLWHYIPGEDGESDELVLVFESSSGKVLESPDNICVTPNGGLIFCEDDAVGGEGAADTHPLAPGVGSINRLIGLGAKGEAFELALNVFSDSEFAGACFSPDGEVLFVNIQGGDSAGSGMTVAIWGPWERGPL